MLITNGSKQLVRYINTGPTSDENGQDSTAQLAGGGSRHPDGVSAQARRTLEQWGAGCVATR